jgi:hypothetical protein
MTGWTEDHQVLDFAVAWIAVEMRNLKDLADSEAAMYAYRCVRVEGEFSIV